MLEKVYRDAKSLRIEGRVDKAVGCLRLTVA